MNGKRFSNSGFTIVELLIVIVVIGILAAITIVAYNGVQTRAANAKRDSDLELYYKAILAARENMAKTTGQVTGSFWSAGSCLPSPGSNTSSTEPRDLPKTNACWTAYYNDLDKIGAAASMNLDGLKAGDARGNPYIIDENEGEGGTSCSKDVVSYFTGSGTATSTGKVIPLSGFSGCAI